MQTTTAPGYFWFDIVRVRVRIKSWICKQNNKIVNDALELKLSIIFVNGISKL